MSRLDEHLQGFVGRIKESRQLGRLFEESLASGARMVLVGGDTGIGKTSLLQQLKGNVKARGGHYMVCKSGPLGSSFPYHPLAELLRILIEELGQGQVKEVISRYSPRVLTELSVLVPKYSNLFNSAVKGYPFAGQLPDKLFLENACTILRDLLRKTPVVLVIEDIPYADPTSLEVIQYFVQHAEDFRALICGTYDLDDIDLSGSRFSPFRNFVRALNYEESLAKINLRPFTREETEEFLLKLLDEKILPTGLGDAVYQKSEGNPLVIRHLVDKLVSMGNLCQTKQAWVFEAPRDLTLPEEIQEIFLHRLEGIKPELRSILATAAVIGRRFTAQNLAQLLNLSLVDLLPSMEEAINLKLIEEHPDSTQGYFTFVSSRLQQVLYESISYQRKVLLHEEVGILLEHTLDPRLHPDELAYHFQWGADKAKAVKYSILAGQRAVALNAYHSAWRYFGAARDLFPLVDPSSLEKYKYPVLEGLTETSSYLGYYGEAWKCLGQLLNMGVAKGSGKYASVQWKLGDLCFRMGNYAETLDHFSLALESARNEQKCLIINRMIQAYQEMGKLEEAQTLAELQLVRAEATGNTVLSHDVNAILTLNFLYAGEVNKAQECSAGFVKYEVPNMLQKINNKIVLGQLMMESGPADQAEVILNEGLQLAKKMQDPLATGVILCHLARVSTIKGDYRRARELIERVKSLEVYSHTFTLKAHVGNLEVLLARLGQYPSDIANLLEGLKVIWQGRTCSAIGASALAHQAELAALKGLLEDSRQLLSSAAEVQAHYPTTRNRVHLLQAEMAVLEAEGQVEPARETLQAIFRLCGQNGMNTEGFFTCKAWSHLSDENCETVLRGKLGLEAIEEKASQTEQIKRLSAAGSAVDNYLPKEVSLVLDFIHCQYATEINTFTLCRVATLSERQLRRLFSQYTGVSIKEYINAYRIEKARELLKNPTLGISQIGELVGMNDKSHFCKTFKALVGVSPSAFRKTQTENVRNNQHIAT